MLKNLVHKAINTDRNTKVLIVILIDIILSILATFFSFVVRLDLETILIFSLNQIYPFIISIIIFIPIFYYLKIYDSIFRYFNLASLQSLSLSTLIYTVPYFFIIYFYSFQGVPRSIGIIQPLFFIILLLISRIFYISLYNFLITNKKSKNIFIYGAGNAGAQLINVLGDASDYKIIGFIDDEPAKIGKLIYGVKIYSFAEAFQICSYVNIDQIFIAISNLNIKQKREILSNIEKLNTKTSILPSLDRLFNENINLKDFREISVSDLIARKVSVNVDDLRHHFKDKKIFVTGAGGSIGSELCIQLAKCEPDSLILIENSEYNLYLIEQKLIDTFSSQRKSPQIISKLIDIKNPGELKNIFNSEKPDYVFHAAAYKHVPLLEKNMKSAIENNYLGTKLVIDAALKCGCKNFVLISTDKAVSPTNIMGATKRLCEMYIQALNNSVKENISYSIVRFGNVLDSSGSVVPLFRNQINAGGPVTVTHPEVTRYFMTIPEAASLILKSTLFSKKGNIFVLDMGDPLKILDLAKKIITLSGLSYDNNEKDSIKIKFTGLRPGEKMHEELYSKKESILKVDEDIFLIDDKGLNIKDFLIIHDNLNNILNDFSDQKTIKFFEENIDGFSNNSIGK